MILPSARFEVPFTCLNAQGVPTAPDVTPVATLFQNGTAQATTVTCTMSSSQGVASCVIPATAQASDRFFMRIDATIGGVVYSIAGPSEAVQSPQTLTSDYNAAKTAAPAGAAMSLTLAERSALAVAIEAELLNDLTGTAFVSTMENHIQALFDNLGDQSIANIATAVTAAVQDSLAEEIAARILLAPENKLMTNTNGYVTVSGSSSPAGASTFVMPLRSNDLERIHANRVDLFARESFPIALVIKDDTGQSVDCSGLTGVVTIEGGFEVAGISPSASVSGGTVDRYSWSPPAELTRQPGNYRFSLRVDDTSQRVLAYGHLIVADVP